MVMTCLRTGPPPKAPRAARQQVEGIKGDFMRDLPKRMQKIANPAERTTAPLPI